MVFLYFIPPSLPSSLPPLPPSLPSSLPPSLPSPHRSIPPSLPPSRNSVAHINVSDDSEDEGAEEGDTLTPFSPLWAPAHPHRRQTTAGLPVSIYNTHSVLCFTETFPLFSLFHSCLRFSLYLPRLFPPLLPTPTLRRSLHLPSTVHLSRSNLFLYYIITNTNSCSLQLTRC